jgi:hypothetical protein
MDELISPALTFPRLERAPFPDGVTESGRNQMVPVRCGFQENAINRIPWFLRFIYLKISGEHIVQNSGIVLLFGNADFFCQEWGFRKKCLGILFGKFAFFEKKTYSSIAMCR